MAVFKQCDYLYFSATACAFQIAADPVGAPNCTAARPDPPSAFSGGEKRAIKKKPH
ncbi:hypothetical protein B4098_2789 [Heyndrickxia coagulans]|uniref:Uncharacterized protein n=1 Tax=Heyndrickxia coagulans TaxID=1398 RepID=A0A150K4B9_HEYCO|nr:hypothetical protein B4098_2789 [Heyndrickxia coagulans]KYC69813.1 hypothetical protein B4099_2980 [Heyndrickxia coagulans]